VTDEPTAGELGRRFDALDRRVMSLQESVARLPTNDLISTQQARIVDRVTQAEKDIAKSVAVIEALAKSLEAERDARQAQVETERARVRTWVQWVFGIAITSGGASAANLFGLRLHN
jgi:hypothetical protein